MPSFLYIDAASAPLVSLSLHSILSSLVAHAYD
jgi:hypothetical protein